MKSKLFTTAIALIATFCVSHPASAFVATTGLDPAINDSGTLAVGSEYTVKGGDFTFYDPGTDGPALVGNPADYRYKATGTIESIDPATDTATFEGKYRVFYDANGNGKYNPHDGDTSVSFGDVDLTISYTPLGDGTVSGTLTQLQGPSNGAAGFSGSASVTGFFQVIDSNHDAEFVVTIASVPEPGTWAAMASGAGLLLGAMRFRKRS